jgi:glycosyltransferase involved in cell wall biosynthesis
MNQQPFLSVIIPLFNKARYIRRAVLSAVQQEYSKFEVLVIDDGSTDGGSSKLEDLVDLSNVRLIRQANAGEGAARNRGLAEMRGEVGVFFDADDELLASHLGDIANLAQTFPEAGLFATRFAYMRDNERLVESTIATDVPILIRSYFEIARRDVFILNSSSTAVRKSVVKELGGFMERVPYGADVEYWGRINLRYPMAYHPRVSSLYHIALPDSAMSNSRWKLDEPPVVRTLKKYLESNPSPENRQDVLDYAAVTIMNLAASGIRSGHSRDARTMLADPILNACRFQRRLLAVRSAAALPERLARTLCQLHTAPWASSWHRMYRNFTRTTSTPIST